MPHISLHTHITHTRHDAGAKTDASIPVATTSPLHRTCIQRCPTPSRPDTCGIKFASRSDAEQALVSVNGFQGEGMLKPLKVQKAELGRAPQGPATLYVSGFDTETCGQPEIQSWFTPMGTVQNVHMHTSKPGRKGVAFVTMENFLEAEEAMKTLNGSNVGSDPITVRFTERMAAVGPTPKTNTRFHPYAAPVVATALSSVMPTIESIPMMQIQPLPQVLATQPMMAEGMTSLFVYGVRNPVEHEMRLLFGAFGDIASLKIVIGKNYFFVDMCNPHEAANAASALNGAVLKGCTVPLQVTFK
eukprot:NODE_1403_length_1173_cov_55.985765_g1149_i0.p1 GENE.NODE_1403_length_1173_cov_55.985765_g1149_i0~~NODE_1403_length_1173_cov_55.985765_g1149_i0.p1  ORF type:complete len:302 (+),score=57.37 NODE_1403_length_1173_cov_55.985765_g1149_i0:213-1118(+)